MNGPNPDSLPLATVRALAAFALETLATLERDEEWGADTFDALYREAAAHDFIESRNDYGGYFTVTDELRAAAGLPADPHPWQRPDAEGGAA